MRELKQMEKMKEMYLYLKELKEVR